MPEFQRLKKVPPATGANAERWAKEPWLLQQDPFHVVGNVYAVGLNWVCCYLLDTSEGLVLIDCAMQEQFYQLVDNIHRLGFDPRKIKKLLLTHGHFDHCGAAGALQQMSGCEVWIGEGDKYFFTERRDLIAFEDHVPPFEITGCYDYSKPIDLGDTQLEVVHCPGHTQGVSSFFFTVDHNGRKLNCAIHGGLGARLVSREYLTSKGLPMSLQQDYLESIEKVIDRHVDVVLPSHPGHCVNHDFLGIAAADDGSGEGFIDPGAWRRMLEGKRAELLAIMAANR